MPKQVPIETYGAHNVPKNETEAMEAIANGDYKPVIDADIEADPGGHGVPPHKVHRRFLEVFTPLGSFMLDLRLYIPRNAIVPGAENQEFFWMRARDTVHTITGISDGAEVNLILGDWMRWLATQGKAAIPPGEVLPRQANDFRKSLREYITRNVRGSSL